MKISQILKTPGLLPKAGFTLFILFIFRLLTSVPVPGIPVEALKSFFSANPTLQVLSMLSGSGLTRISILAIGLNPYINASYIFQLLSAVIPSIKEMYENAAERRVLTMYTRLLAIPLAAIQGVVFYAGFAKSHLIQNQTGILGAVAIVSIFVFGSMITMWLGELISAYGMGGGSSMIILAGILVSLPQSLKTNFMYIPDISRKAIMVAIVLVIFLLAILMSLAVREIKVIYAKRVRASGLAGYDNFIPIAINPAGVMPVIFAYSIIDIPKLVLSFIATKTEWGKWATMSAKIVTVLSNPWIYYGLIFSLTVGFALFSAFLVLRVKDIADNLAKQGAFVEGLRPGKETERYLKKRVLYTVLYGSLLLGILVLMPTVLFNLLKFPQMVITGTGALIIASVLIDVIRQVESFTAVIAEPKEYY